MIACLSAWKAMSAAIYPLMLMPDYLSKKASLNNRAGKEIW
jgi:hypothetical protein